MSFTLLSSFPKYSQGSEDGSLQNTEIITLSQENIDNKSFSLSYSVLEPTKIELTPIGGIMQVYGVDYVYSLGSITWVGLGLDGFLEPGEKIFVRY